MCKAENPTTSGSSVQDPPPAYEATWPRSYQDPAPSSDKAPPPPVTSGAQNVVEPPADRGTHPQQQPVDQAVRRQGLPVDALADDPHRRHPLAIECPRCHAQVITYVKSRLGVKNVVGAAVVGVTAPPLLWVPLVMPGTHRRTHYCPQCKRKIGRGHRKNKV
ncbi:hypothetical protein IWQ57_003008, partial [Coemansia nantahalensis]